MWSWHQHSDGVRYSTLIVQLHGNIYKGPEISLGAIEFAPLKSPLSVKPGAFVELSTCHCR